MNWNFLVFAIIVVHNFDRMSSRRIIVFLAAPVLAVTLLIGGGMLLVRQRAQDPSTSSQLQVVTTLYPYHFFAQRIAGDRATVTLLVPEGADAHENELTQKDVATMSQADLVLLNGAGLEPWQDRVIPEIAARGVAVVVTSEALAANDPSTLVNYPGGATNPHLWLDPVLAGDMVAEIRDAFVRIDPASATAYQERAGILQRELHALDAEFRSGLALCAHREIVVAHNAYAYLARRYALTVSSLTDLSPDEEPSPRRLVDLAAFMRKQQMTTVFAEPYESADAAQALATSVGGSVRVLHPLESITDVDRNAGKNYLTIMRENMNELRSTLVCQ